MYDTVIISESAQSTLRKRIWSNGRIDWCRTYASGDYAVYDSEPAA